MEKQVNIPKLRFPEFDGNWEMKKLGEVSELITKGTTPKKFINEGIKFIKLECFEGDKINGDKCLFIDEKTHNKELKRSILKENDLLFAIAGATIGKVNFVTNEILPANTNQALSIIRLKEKECRNYIYQILKSNRMQKYITDSISVGAQPNLNLEQMNKFSFFYPNIPEQTKIASFLTAVDDKLQTLKKKKQLLEQYKKGVMQKIFSQEIRFKDDNGNEFAEWEEKKLGDLKLYISDGNYGELYPKASEMKSTGIPFIRANNIKNLLLTWDDMRFIDEEHHKILASGHLLENDILVTTRGDIGMVAYVTSEFSGSNINAQICLLRCNENLNSKYLIQYLASNFGYKQFKSLQTGSALKQLPKGNLIKLNILIPALEEQTKIANFLSAIDDKIQAVETQIEKMEIWKKGLLQQLFC
jgi:type I restriction enzyme S subunit